MEYWIDCIHLHPLYGEELIERLIWFEIEIFRLRDADFAGKIKPEKIISKKCRKFCRKDKRPYLCRPKAKKGFEAGRLRTNNKKAVL